MNPAQLLKIGLVAFGVGQFGFSASAKVLITNIAGASNFELATETTGTSVFGGTAGEACTGNNVDPCNSCATTTGLKACNERRIYQNLQLRFDFQSDTKTGTPILARADDTAGTRIGNRFGNPTTAAQVTVSAFATWGEICEAFTQVADCSKPFTGSLRVGLDEDRDTIFQSGEESITVSIKVFDPNKDSDGTRTTAFDTNKGCDPSVQDADAGLCYFAAAAGDAKVLIDDPRIGDGTTSVTIPLQGIRVFMSTENFICDPNESLSPADIGITEEENGEIRLDNQIVDGLENGTRYYFRVATVDEANNIFAFTDDSVINAECGTAYDCAGGSRSLGNLDVETCPFIARPDEVLGLLTEDFNCFIATAAYGSPLDKRLDVLRNFRSKILNRFALGKKFVQFYYKKGPYAGKWVAENSWSRPIIQAVLWPAWGFAWVGVHFGLTAAFALSFLILGLLIFGFKTLLRAPPTSEEKAFE